MTNVVAIIVNFRTPGMTVRALESLLAEMVNIPGSRAVVVDNDSGDGSLEEIRDAVQRLGAQNRVDVLQSGYNGGFGYGVNFGICHVMESPVPPDAVYLLNSDAIIDPGGLRSLLAFQEEYPEAAIAGSYIHGPDGEPHCTSFRFPSLPGEMMSIIRLRALGKVFGRWEIPVPWPSEPRRVDWLAGASMLIRRDVIDAIGLFDERYFLYYEETDFCRRAANAGYQTWYVPSSSVAHIGGASTGFKDVRKPRARYWFESRRHYFLTHHGSLYLQATNVVWVLSFIIWRLRRLIARIPDSDPPRLLGDFFRFSFFSRCAN